MKKEKDEIQKPISLCHSHESENPGEEDKKKIDFRFHVNDINKKLIGNRY